MEPPEDGCAQLCRCLIALVHIYFNAPFDDGTERPRRQGPGGVLPDEHFVEGHTGGVKVGAGIRLGKAVLLRRGIAGGAHDPRVAAVRRVGYPGDIKVDQHQLIAPQDQVFRFDIPVDDSGLVQNGERVAELADNICRLRLRQEALFQKEGQCIAGYKLLYDGGPVSNLLHLVDLGKVRAMELCQLLVHVSLSFKFPVDTALTAFAVPGQINAAVSCGFQLLLKPYGF